MTDQQQVVYAFSTASAGFDELQTLMRRYPDLAQPQGQSPSFAELVAENEALRLQLRQQRRHFQKLSDSRQRVSRARTDIENLLRSTKLATILLSDDGTIREFTPAAREFYHLQPGDIGRNIRAVSPVHPFTPVLPNNLPGAIDALDLNFSHLERFWLRRIQPHFNEQHERDGLLLTFVDVTQTERRKRQLRNIADALPALIGFLDNSMCYQYVNQAYAKFWKQDRKAFIGLHIREVLGAEAFRIAEPRLRAAFRGEPQHFNLTIRNQLFSKPRKQEVSYIPERGRGGEIVGCYLMSINVTEQMRAKEQLMESNERLAMALRSSGLGVFEWDLSTDEVQLTDQLRQLLGLKPDEAWTKNDFLATLHADDRSRVEQELQQAILQRGSFCSQFRVVLRDGRQRWLAGEATVQSVPQRNTERMVGMNWDITDQIERETSLRLRHLAMDAIESGIVISDANSPGMPMIHVNRGFEQLTGYSSAEAIGKNCRFLQGTKTDPQAIEQIRDALKNHRACTVTLLNYRKDGSPFWNELKLTPVENEVGSVTHYVGVQHDVTERLASERFIRRVLNSLFTFAGVCTPDGVLIESNFAALHVGELTPEDFLGKPLPETYWWNYDPDVQQALWNAIEQARQGQTPRYDATIRVGDNQYITIDFQIVPMRDDSGNITHLVPSAIDITQRLRDQERLTVLVTMAEQSSDFIAICDLTGKGIYVNAAGRRLVGIDADCPAEQINVRDLFFTEDWPLVSQAMQTAIESGQDTRELRFRHQLTQEAIDVSWDVFRIDSPGSGQPFAIGTITKDIRQQKADQRRLMEAREKADAANRSKSEFLANMSHEIRTPMTAIVGYAELLMDQLEGDSDRALVGTIQQNSEHLLQIINDILDLSKIESGKLQILLAPLSPVELIHDVCNLMKLRADEKGLEIHTAIDPNVPETIRSDRLRLKQILINFVSNAIKFTDAGSVTMRARHDKVHNQLELSVIDTGIGISEEHQEILFQPFTQLDGSDTRSIGGTGLGLAISRRLATRLGGKLLLESQLGRGSTFSVRLDLKGRLPKPPLKPQQSITKKIRKAADNHVAPVNHLPVHALVVDDRPEIRFLAQRILESVGGSVKTASNAQQALTMVSEAAQTQNPIDLILTDIQMPEMDGYELTRRLRASGFDRPIIALTAHALPEELDRCLASGCDAYASKPLEKNRLLRLIADQFKNPSQQHT